MGEARLTHLRALEAESIEILREVAASFDRPVMLYSIGKDSSVLLHLARKAFFPSRIPFPLLHIDTTWKFKRDDRLPRQDGGRIRSRPDRPYQSARRGVRHRHALHARLVPLHRHHEDGGAAPGARCRQVSTRPSAARGATRRRAAPRSASSRTATPEHAWDPKNQRPELWNVYNTRHEPPAKACACSRCPTGPSSTSGLHLGSKTSRSCRSISPGRARSSSVRRHDDHGGRRAPAERARTKGRARSSCASARSAAIR
jgi:hypothetical protein